MVTIHRYLNLLSLKNKWLGIQNRSCITPFQDYFFVRNLWFNYYPYCFSQRCIPVFFDLEDDGETKLIAPLCYCGERGYKLFGAVNGCEYCDFIYSKEIDLENYLPPLLDYLRNNISFDMVREDSFLYRYLINQNVVYNDRPETNVHINIPVSYSHYYGSLSSSTRQNLRTAYNRINRDKHIVRLIGLVGKEYVYECVMDCMKITDERTYSYRLLTKKEKNHYFNDMIDLYVKRHEERYNVHTSRLKSFYLKSINFSTINLKALDNSCNIMIYIDDELAAFMGGFIDRFRKSLVIPRLSINNFFKFYSPGVILINESILFCQKVLSLVNLDLGRGGEKYKYVMGGESHLTHKFSITTLSHK